MALAVTLALTCWGSTALATQDPIPGVDIIVKKNPGGIPLSAPTNNDGTYKFTGLAPGKYDLSVAGKHVQTVTVGDNRSIGGTLNGEPDGTASLRINGQTEVVSVGPAGAPVSTTRSNKKHARIVADKEPESDEPPGAPVSTSRSNKKAGMVAGKGVHVAAGDVSGDGRAEGISVVATPINDAPARTADIITGAGPGGGPAKASPGYAEVAAAKASAKHGEYKELAPGAARARPNAGFTPAPQVAAQLQSGSSAGASSAGGTAAPNANNKGASVPAKGAATEQKSSSAGASVAPDGAVRDAAGMAVARPAEFKNAGAAPKAGKEDIPGMAIGEPIPGIDIVVKKNPGGIPLSVPTNSDGTFRLTGLAPGNYDLSIAAKPDQSNGVGAAGIIALSVGSDGTISGSVARGKDGRMNIFDRWGNRTTPPSKTQAGASSTPDDGSKSKAPQVGGFGTGMGTGPMNPGGPMGPGAGPMAPGAGPMGPGAGPMGPGGPMGGGAMRP
ncbi:MAG: carboxypeptidase-like regulatory domain-containing protein [Rhodocyclaceae bacterium]|nr:carboxypeptidase-like regulatory domain-containing protein [Rhodocyclaceae bacterium]